MSAHVVKGAASVNAWDQNHAEAMKRLRHADAFVIVTWDTLDDHPQLSMLSKRGDSAVLGAMIVAAAHGLSQAADDVAELAKAGE